MVTSDNFSLSNGTSKMLALAGEEAYKWLNFMLINSHGSGDSIIIEY